MLSNDLGCRVAGSSAKARRFPRFALVGDCAVLVELAGEISAATQVRIAAFDEALRAADIAGVEETVPAYVSLLVIYDPLVTSGETVAQRLRIVLWESVGEAATLGGGLASAPTGARAGALAGTRRLRQVASARPSRRCWRIPVAYGDDFGPDLDAVAGFLAMTPDRVVRDHAGGRYVVTMFGFLPGFAYLSGLPHHLATPRRASPRAHMPSGTIAIGGAQTAVGSIAGPCGWNVIGRTPVRTFAADREPISFLEVGDEVMFEPVGQASFREMEDAALRGDLVAALVEREAA